MAVKCRCFKTTVTKAAAGIMLFAAFVFILSYRAFASADVTILVNGSTLECSEKPFIKDGTTFVPMRDIFESLGADVYWNDDERCALINYKTDVVTLFPDNGRMSVNGEAVIMQVHPVIEGGRIMLPLRVVAEGMGCSVIWDGKTYTVGISDGGLMKVSFLGCGQADAIFTQLPDGKCMLIDAGEKAFSQPLSDYIKNKGYSHIDAVVATHPHSDHIGGMAHILDSFSVGTFYMPEVSHTTKTFENMLDALLKNGCRTQYISKGDVLSGGMYDIAVLSPLKKEYARMNNYSAVLKLTFGSVDILFSADAEALAEEDMVNSALNLDAEILKVGHHGSDTSSRQFYLDAVSPNDAVICAKENTEGFPSQTVLDALAQMDAQVYITGEEGAVSLVTDGYIYVIEKE